MWKNNADKIELIELKNKKSGLNVAELENSCIELEWDDVVSMMTKHIQREQKDGLCFMPIVMKPKEDWILSKPRKNHTPTYRNDENVQAITMAVIDLDQNGAIQKAEKVFENYEYVIYSTHSYTRDTPYKFRMVLQLEKPILAENWPKAFRSLVSGIDADKNCGNLSRLFYFPSTSSTAGIRPFSKHNPGKALSENDILKIGQQYESSLTNEEKNSLLKKTNQTFVEKGLRHFAGTSLVSNQSFLLAKQIDYSYDGLKKRHKKSIDNLVSDDSRHNFALKVISREISIFQRKTDLLSLVQFIYRASNEYSSKSILNGNTGEELAEMIESAYIKYAPVSENKNSDYIDNLESHLSEVLEQAESIAITGRWIFPENKTTKEFKKNIMLINNDVDYSYNGMRNRHLGVIREMINNHDTLLFAKKIISREFDTFGDKTNINHIGQFLYFCYSGYLKKCKGVSNIAPELDKITTQLIHEADSIRKEINADEKMTMYMKTSFTMGKKSAMEQREWQFGTEISPNKEPALAK